MSLKFAILTSLTERAGSGIELARRFDKSIGYFWPATHQQIYRELDRLGESGLIRELPLEGAPSRGNPRRFEVTEDGRRLLTEWIR
ncbi:PadR family transcriptional regulator, partial [Dietzia sp. CW19]|nr:PadR family transcriptional regulator [Dietzia sp. CW19]